MSNNTYLSEFATVSPSYPSTFLIQNQSLPSEGSNNGSLSLGFDIFGDQDTFRVLIQDLSTQQSAKAGETLDRYSWSPLKLQDERTVLVNIQSAMERLGVFGIDKRKVSEALNKGHIDALLMLIKERQSEILKKELQVDSSKIEARLPSILNQMLDWIYVDKLNFEDVKAIIKQTKPLSEKNLEKVKNCYLMMKKYNFDIDWKEAESLVFAEKNDLIQANQRVPIPEIEKFVSLCRFARKINLKRKDIPSIAQLFFNSVDAKTIQEIHHYAQTKRINYLEAEVSIFAAKYKVDVKIAKSVVNSAHECEIPYAEVVEIHNYLSRHGLPPSMEKLLANYRKTFGVQSLEQAHNGLQLLFDKHLNENEISNLMAFVKDALPEWRVQRMLQKHKQPIYVFAKDHPGLPRNLQYNLDGSIWIVFNKTKKGDPLLGQGSYKSVKTWLNLSDPQSVDARLTTALKTPSIKELTVDELQLSLALSRHNHPGIAHTIAGTVHEYASRKTAAKRGLKIHFAQPHYNGGDLFDRLFNNDTPIPPEKKLFILERLLHAISWLNTDQKLIHRDLKPENIMLMVDPLTGEIIDVVIGDFGLTCEDNDETKRSTVAGSPQYVAPELLQSFEKEDVIAATTSKNDSWSMGLILFELYRFNVPEWGDNVITPNDYFTRIQLDIEDAGTLYRELFSFITSLGNDWLPEPAEQDSVEHMIWELLRPVPTERISTLEAYQKVALIKERASNAA